MLTTIKHLICDRRKLVAAAAVGGYALARLGWFGCYRVVAHEAISRNLLIDHVTNDNKQWLWSVRKMHNCLEDICLRENDLLLPRQATINIMISEKFRQSADAGSIYSCLLADLNKHRDLFFDQPEYFASIKQILYLLANHYHLRTSTADIWVYDRNICLLCISSNFVIAGDVPAPRKVVLELQPCNSPLR